MKQAIEAFQEISESVNKNCKDSSLLSNLQKCLFTLEPEAIDVQVYSRLMLSVYDLSNHYTLVQQQNNDPPIKINRIMVHNLSVRLKLVAMRMICSLMQLMSRGIGNCQRLHQQVQIQALQIMILSIRLCLDSEVKCLQQVIENQKFCAQLFSYYCTYDHEISQTASISRNKPINEEMELLFYINKFDILRLTLSQNSFQIYDFKNSLINFNATISKSNTISQQNREKYHQYITNIVTQIILKLLREGNTDCFYKLSEYLPAQTRTTIEKLLSGDISERGQMNMGEVYELYWQISVNGMQSISLESLQLFIAKDAVFEGQQIFQAILLTEQPVLLQIWFNLVNQRMSRPPNIIIAYECFISLVITFINKQKATSTRSNKSPQQKQQYLNGLVRLCKQVMLNLIRENKQTVLPVGAIAQYIAKFMLLLVTQMYKYASCKEIFENLYMISTKHSLQQVNKTISALHLYYDLLNRQSNEQVYKKFLKFNGTDRSETMKLLKTCYEMQKSNTQINQSTLNIIQRKPEFALLFCEPKERAMLILNMDIKCLSEMPNIFQIFMALFEQNTWDDANLIKIAIHLQSLLLSCQFSKMSLNQDAAIKLKRSLGKNLQNQNPIFCILFLYMSCFVKEFEKIKNQSYGLAFNKFGKLLKILDFLILEEQQICILKIIICKTCEKFKKQTIGNTGKCSPEAGQIMFLKIIYQKIQQWINGVDSSSMQTNHRNSQQFVKFSLFQIYCLNNRLQEIQEIIDEEQNSIMQHLYVNSQYIPRKYKLILLRKLFKTNLTGVSSIITLNDLKQLILLAETSQEISIYISSTIQMFGEKGKRFINLLALEYSRVADQCLQISNSQSFAI